MRHHSELLASVTLAQSAGDQPRDKCQSLESDDAACINDTEAADDGALVTFSTALQSLDNLCAYPEAV